ncbi:class I SAM-dependent methyltransferase [Ornatilinea apprima]|uniref:class I SAM-dependent methyltransferase n=1 Tax=Ornatilinea apprima TaxID=1134406 RepID=UPI0009462658|nr:class I SAM-dependent methyltransferase [Ornatilinea apprima]
MQTILGQIDAGQVLDVATGRGGFIEILVQNLRSFEQITGVDVLSGGAAAFAEKFQSHSKIHFQQMDAAHLAFPDVCFDTVCISNSLHHLPHPRRALLEMLRVLRPGGQLLLCEMYRDGQTETQQTHVLLHDWWAAIDMAQGITHYPTFTRQQLVGFLEDLPLANLALHDLCDLSDNPLEPSNLADLDQVIDRYIARSQGLPNAKALQEQGEALRQRVHNLGYHDASALLAIGQKFSV